VEFADKRDDEMVCREARRESARRRGVELGQNFSDEEFREAVRAAVSHARHGEPLHDVLRQAMKRPKRRRRPVWLRPASEVTRCHARTRSAATLAPGAAATVQLWRETFASTSNSGAPAGRSGFPARLWRITGSVSLTPDLNGPRSRKRSANGATRKYAPGRLRKALGLENNRSPGYR
jgi:hypothetical protein